MTQIERESECEFYKQQLTECIFPFWEKNSIDYEYGGFFTCFSNQDAKLISTDKYTWSQGRMLYILSKIYQMKIFSEDKSKEIYQWAKNCADFLMKNCLLPSGNCTFLMTQEGQHKKVGEVYDSSIYADCFVIIGFSSFALISHDEKALNFAQTLYQSVLDRYNKGDYLTEPYPIPKGFRTHGVPMILVNTSRVLSDTQRQLCKEWKVTAQNAYDFACDIADNFVDENNVLHEFIPIAGGFNDELLLLRYRNPGHTIEDSWFLLTEFTKHNDNARMQKTVKILKSALNAGFDNECGGIFLFADKNGGCPKGDICGYETDPMVLKVQNDWSSKLWWPHSEALYATLFANSVIADDEIMKWYQIIKEYTFKTFPDKNNGEWIQIRNRYGIPENRVVALPVKDPFHIMRNFLLIIELLSN